MSDQDTIEQLKQKLADVYAGHTALVETRDRLHQERDDVLAKCAEMQTVIEELAQEVCEARTETLEYSQQLSRAHARIDELHQLAIQMAAVVGVEASPPNPELWNAKIHD